jgi:uncharacterized protein (TIGR02246 family)
MCTGTRMWRYPPESMPDAEQVTRWIEAYRRAWNSNDPQDIGALFAEDARYVSEPFSEPWRGRAAIVKNWLGRKDAPGQTEFEWRLVATVDDLAIVQGTTTYLRPPATYSNLWLIRLDPTGQCTTFSEWWMRHPTRR